VSFLLKHALGVATALNHEVVDDTMKNGSIVVMFTHVLQKISNCFGGVLWIEFNHNVAHVGAELYFWVFNTLALRDGQVHVSQQGKTGQAQEDLAPEQLRQFVLHIGHEWVGGGEEIGAQVA
jgi:hypothetical protein